jgi:maleate cis-trans isomerase
METEIPAMLRAREAVEPERFTFHSSRMRMQNVTKEELEGLCHIKQVKFVLQRNSADLCRWNLVTRSSPEQQ